ncbi:hypothetical protein [Pararhizobium gei]|uniref:hypothetical protein n=1 Tax=Pararhizobium gei TaxID=1395951 RepID=UPI0023DB0CC4|nr:hypothetical protein [Rhizobium gei]
MLEGKSNATLPVADAARFKVYRPETMELRAGDLIRVTENGTSMDGHRVTNGAVYHCAVL